MNSHQFDYSESNYVHIEKLQIAFKLCLQKLKSSRADAFNNTYTHFLLVKVFAKEKYLIEFLTKSK